MPWDEKENNELKAIVERGIKHPQTIADLLNNQFNRGRTAQAVEMQIKRGKLMGNNTHMSRRLAERQKKTNLGNKTWEDMEMARILALRNEGHTIERTTEILNEEFGNGRTMHAVQQKLSKLQRKAKAANKPKHPNTPKTRQMWDARQVQFMVEYYGEDYTYAEIADLMYAEFGVRRTGQAVKTKHLKINPAEQQGKPKRHKKFWSAKEEKFVLDNYGKMSDEEIGEKLGRTSQAIYDRYHYLNQMRGRGVIVFNEIQAKPTRRLVRAEVKKLKAEYKDAVAETKRQYKERLKMLKADLKAQIKEMKS